MMKKFRKVMSLLLVMAMMICLCSCGKKDGGSQTSGTSGSGSGSSGSMTEAQVQAQKASKEYVYSSTPVNLGVDNISSILGKTVTDNGIGLIVFSYQYEEGSSEGEQYYYSKLGLDGSFQSKSTLELPTVEYFGFPVLTDSDTGYAGVTVSNFAFANDGSIYAICNGYYYDYSDYDNYVNEQKYNIIHWSENGGEYTLLDLPSEIDLVNGWVQYAFCTEDGLFELIVSNWSDDNSGYYSYYLDAEGNLVKSIKNPDDSGFSRGFDSFFRGSDGMMYAVSTDWGEDKVSSAIYRYNASSNDLSTVINVPEKAAGNAGTWTAYDDRFYYSMSDGVYYFGTDGKPVKVLDYVNSDLDTSYLGQLIVIDPDHFIISYYDSVSESDIFALVTHVAPEEVVDKQTITIGGFDLSYYVRGKVVEFNKTNPNYRIVIKDYANQLEAYDYDQGYTLFNNDILAGNQIDIFFIGDSSKVNVRSLAKKGLFADIGNLIASDSELCGYSYLNNVRDTYKIDGKEYLLVPSFHYNTIVGKTELVGNDHTWSMSEMLDLLKQFPDASLLENCTREEFVRLLMNYCGSEYVDVSTGVCDFNKDSFKLGLEYAGKLPEEINWDEIYNSDNYWVDYQSYFANNTILLKSIYLSSLYSYHYYIVPNYMAPVTMVGFPSESGCGTTIEASQMFAINAKSNVIDGAWSFLRYYLTPEYQNTLDYEVPVLESAFDNWAAKASERPYWENEKGEKEYYDETFWINEEEIVVNPMDSATLEDLKTYLKSVNKTVYNDDAVISIVLDEVGAYFSGQKSIDDVVNVIQSRVSLYVVENL